VDDATLGDALKTGNECGTYNGSWMEQWFSPLTEIKAANVSRPAPGRPIRVAATASYR